MADWWVARELASAAIDPGPTQEVAVTQSVGSTLAVDVHALVDLPGFPTAAMDGWVVAGEGPWEIVGTIDTGVPAARELIPGQAMRIATGGLVPAGGEAVVPWEIAAVARNRLTAKLPDKAHIRPRGEECSRGDLLARRGDRVNPALAGLIAAAGLDRVLVFVRPRIAALVLGDEVIVTGLPGDGQVRDALGVQLPGWIEALGGNAISVSAVPDEPDALANSLRQAVQDADVVIATGGTARGHRDFLRGTLEKLRADVRVDGVAVRPGHPMMLAVVDDTPIIGLPGNPLSALVALVTLLEPLLGSWHGRPGSALPNVQMAEAVPASAKDFTRLMVGRRELGGFRQVTHVSSAMLRGIAHADGWAIIPSTGVAPGEIVPWIPVPWMGRTDRG